MGDLDFDASSVAPETAMEPLPTGWYSMFLANAEMVEHESAGKMLKLTHEINADVHPELANRKAMSNLCLQHPNDTPRRIANGTLSQICRSIGIMQLADSSELIGAPLLVRLVVKPAKDGYDAKNDVKGYKPLSDTPPAAVPAGQKSPEQQRDAALANQPAAAPQAARAPATQPWKRGG